MKNIRGVKKNALSPILSRIIKIQKEINNLPALSVVNKVNLDHSIAIEQLYYSSKLEGTNLTQEIIDSVINGNGTKVSTS